MNTTTFFNGLTTLLRRHDSGHGKRYLRGLWGFFVAMGALLLIPGPSLMSAARACEVGCAYHVQAKAACFEDAGGLEEDVPILATSVQKAIGWVVGGVAGGYGTILHTTNGGQSWARQGIQDTIANVPLYGVAAVDAREAWVAGGSVILHTRDGGQNWCREANSTDLTGIGLQSVYALDLYTAWAVGNGGVILRTTNGGCVWQRQGVGQIPVVDLIGVYASDACNVWVVGKAETGNQYGTILHTTDGGDTWVKVPYTITHTPLPTDFYLLTIRGANANQLWAVGHDQILHITVTQKGIISVTDQTPAFSPFMDINGVFAVNSNTVWAVADAGNIWRTDNGGRKWVLRNTGSFDHGYIIRVSAIDGRNVWATVTDQSGGGQVAGQIVYTSNGGKSWAPQTIPVQTGMWGISFVR